MPPYAKHLEISQQRTGNDYQQMHDWLDNHPDHKAARHDLDALAANRAYVKATWGEEAVTEFLLHVTEDLLMKDTATLKNAGVPEDAVQHSLEVARKCLEIASRVKIPVDKHLLAKGALFHDLGKAKSHGLDHGEIGAQMAVDLGLDETIRQIILKHVRAGLTESEAKEYGLPVRDYTLRTPEEKIVTYADWLVDIYTDGIVPGANEAMAEAQYVEIVNSYDKYSKTPATKQRFLALHTEIQGWMA